MYARRECHPYSTRNLDKFIPALSKHIFQTQFLHPCDNGQFSREQMAPFSPLTSLFRSIYHARHDINYPLRQLKSLYMYKSLNNQVRGRAQ